MSELKRELPLGWTSCPLDAVSAPEPGSFVDGPFGSNLKTEHYTNSGPRVIRLENVGDGVFRNISTHISAAHFDRLRRHEARERDVVIALLGDKVPRACLVPAGVGMAIVKADCPRLRPNAALALPEFVAYALNSEQVRRQAKALVHGVGRPRLKLSELRDLTVRIPPLAEQRRIVEALDTQFTRIDAAIATLGRIRAQIDRYRDSVRQTALDGRFGSSSQFQAWPRVHVSDLVWDSGYGSSVKCSPDAPGIPVLRIPNVAYGHVDLGDLKFAVGALQVSHEEGVGPGDFLVVRTNGSRSLIGRAAFIDVAMPRITYFASYLIRLRLREPQVWGRWLRIVWDAPSTRQHFEAAAATSAGQYNLGLRAILGLTVPTPRPDQVAAIVAEVEAHLSVADNAARLVAVQQARCERLRRSILRCAFEGRLIAQDARDEPASVLLDRIRDERTFLTPTPMKKPTRARR